MSSIESAGSVTQAELLETANRIRRDSPDATAGLRAYMLAVNVVFHLLGRDWVHRFLDPAAEPEAHIGSIHDQGMGNVFHQGRVVELAEGLFNLQSVPGFLATRLSALRNDAQGVEAANMELLVGRVLKKAGIDFSYVRGTKRDQDYEIDFRVGSQTYPMEVKLKRADTECSAATIRDSLETARKQLPKGRPGVVVLGIPESWTALAMNEEVLRLAILERFRQTTRIAAALYFWRESALSLEGGLVAVRYATLRNEAVALPVDVEAFLHEFPVADVGWTSLRSVAAGDE